MWVFIYGGCYTESRVRVGHGQASLKATGHESGSEGQKTDRPGHWKEFIVNPEITKTLSG